MGPHGRIPDTNINTEVIKRINEVTKNWLQAAKETETITFADTNINLANINKLPHELNPHDRKQIPAMRILKDKILNEGITVINTKETRYNHITKTEEWIDHCYTTNPEKLSNQTIHHTGDSDHFIGQFTFTTTVKPSHPRFVITRDWDRINWDLIKLNLSIDPDLEQAATMKDPHDICQTIQDCINYQLDSMAPQKKIQLKSKFPAFASPESRLLITERDEQYKVARETDDQDVWRLFKNLRNRVHRSLKNDKKITSKKNSTTTTNRATNGTPLKTFSAGPRMVPPRYCPMMVLSLLHLRRSPGY